MNQTDHISNKDIGILICYFGEFPWYFNYFLHSCRYNPSIDFLIVTDRDNQTGIEPDNVKFIRRSLTDINQLATKKLGFETGIEKAYKLCDFKPAYGYIFSELLGEYDFWGHSDLDIIYGDIRGFFTTQMLSTYDFINVRHDYTSGCFAVYKNGNNMNSLFMLSKDYQRALSVSQYVGFDESNFKNLLLTEGASIFDLETDIESFTYVVKKAAREGKIKAHFDFILFEGVTGKIRFDHGRMIFKNQFEGILYHLYMAKKTFKPRKPRHIPDHYHISKTRIYH